MDKLFSVKSLGLTYPARKEVVTTTFIVACVMLFGGAFLFLIDTLSVYLFAVLS